MLLMLTAGTMQLPRFIFIIVLLKLELYMHLCNRLQWKLHES